MRMKCRQKVEIIDQKWNGITSSKFVASFFVFILLSIFNCYSDAWLLCSGCFRCACHARTFFWCSFTFSFAARAPSLPHFISLCTTFCYLPFWLEVTCTSPDVQFFFHTFHTHTASFSSCYNYFHKQPMAIRQQHFTKTTINSLNAAISYGEMEVPMSHFN